MIYVDGCYDELELTFFDLTSLIFFWAWAMARPVPSCLSAGYRMVWSGGEHDRNRSERLHARIKAQECGWIRGTRVRSNSTPNPPCQPTPSPATT